jgi:putative oxidoreductase
MRQLATPDLFLRSQWSPVFLRLVVGYGFVQHGVAKLLRGPDAFAGLLQRLGVPVPHLLSWLTILTEVLGGLAVFLGVFVMLVCLPMAIVLLTAIFMVHWQYGFSSVKLVAVTSAGAQFGPVGYETNLLYLAALVCLVMGGPGPLAIQGLIRRQSRHAQTVRASDSRPERTLTKVSEQHRVYH